jgi:ectoine hydroxylase-related dioxygenase (phytanoyl-CoA dioxygenase family)
MAPGDCIVFHMRTVHGAPGTASLTTRRRGFSTRWLGDDAVFAVRPGKTSPPFPEVKLAPGAPMHHPSFPLAWQAGQAF